MIWAAPVGSLMASAERYGGQDAARKAYKRTRYRRQSPSSLFATASHTFVDEHAR